LTSYLVRIAVEAPRQQRGAEERSMSPPRLWSMSSTTAARSWLPSVGMRDQLRYLAGTAISTNVGSPSTRQR